MSHLAFEIILRLAKAGVAFIVGTVIFAFLIGPIGATPTRRARAPVLAERRGLHPARRVEPDLTRSDGPPGAARSV